MATFKSASQERKEQTLLELEQMNKKLQDATARYEGMEKAVQSFKSQISSFDEIIKAKQHLIATYDEAIASRKEVVDFTTRPGRQEEKQLVESIQYLKSVKEALEEKEQQLKSLDKEVVSALAEREAAKRDVENLEKEAERIQVELKKKRQEADKILDLANKKALKLREREELLRNFKTSIDEFHKVVMFYARRLKKYYAEHGNPLPKEFNDLEASLKVFPKKK